MGLSRSETPSGSGFGRFITVYVDYTPDIEMRGYYGKFIRHSADY